MTDDGSDEVGGATVTEAVVLDFLPNGRPSDDRPRYRKSPVGYVLGEADFRLLELVFDKAPHINIGDRIAIDPPHEDIVEMDDVTYDELSGAARSELEYAVDAIMDADEQRFVDYYNEAGPITLRLHQLNLLPGIGKKLRNNILDARKRKPFESFEELDERVAGLHHPREVLKERVIEEIQTEEMKYRIFARRPKKQE
jgi:putative nucleotide binding protein